MIPVARPFIGREEREAVDRVLASGQLAQGPEVEAFETEFCAALGEGGYGVAVNSGTAALQLGLMASGIGPGDEVIVPSFTFAATANAVVLAGAEPVFVDIAFADFCLDPEAVAAAITPRTAAILPVHLYGHPAPMEQLSAIAARHHLLILEDAAQAHGAQWHARPVGTLGDVAAFSFYPTKNMTTGEGGLIMTADPAIAERARLLRNQGMKERYTNEVAGFNARMTDLAAAIGRVQLTRLPDWIAARRSNAAHLDAALQGVDLPAVAAGATHAYHQYTVRSRDRDGLVDRLARHEVGCGVYYPTPVHALPSFDRDLELPETARACREVLSLPVHPGLERGDLERIVTAVNA